MTYDHWKTRSPDDDVFDEYEPPSDLMQFMDCVDVLCQSTATCSEYWARVESLVLLADAEWKGDVR